MSPGTEIAVPPDVLIASATPFALASKKSVQSQGLVKTRKFRPASISDTTTLAPSFAKRRAVSAPIPCPEPVMIATCPARRPLG
jgi:hypothetical protein